MKDRYGREIKLGDILLNLQDTRSPSDAWKHLICVGTEKEKIIRDFNAWNQGYEPDETIVIGNYRDYPELLNEEGKTVHSITEHLAEDAYIEFQDQVPEIITGVAVRLLGRNILTLAAPHRHNDLFRVYHYYGAHYYGAEGLQHAEQGFWTTANRFVNRVEAKYIAREAGQLIKDSPGKILYSEDMW